MMGMSSPEWSGYLSQALGVPGSPAEINDAIVERMLVRYGTEPPLIPGAVEAVRRLAARWPIGIASSSNPSLIEAVVQPPASTTSSRSRCRPRMSAAASRHPTCISRRCADSAPTPERCAAIEDSEPGLRSAKTAGLRVIAVPNLHFPPSAEALAPGRRRADGNDIDETRTERRRRQRA